MGLVKATPARDPAALVPRKTKSKANGTKSKKAKKLKRQQEDQANPATRAGYALERLEPVNGTLAELYPDIVKCFGCNTCTKACPQELDVMWFMSDALRGDIKAVAEKSFDCVMCGLCAARCPQGLAPYNVARLARRLYGRYLAPASGQLDRRIEEIVRGDFDAALDELKQAGLDELKRRYAERDVEPALEQTWE